MTEHLAVGNMTASAKGTIEKPGKNVKAKAGLNRAILDATPGSFLNMLATKAEEAGCELIILNTRKERPSQTCPSCGTVRKKRCPSGSADAIVGSMRPAIRRRRWRCLWRGGGFQVGNRPGHAQAGLKPSIRAAQRLDGGSS